jgi:hypothetical protein
MTRSTAGTRAPERDRPALAAVLVNATSHSWLLGDILGEDRPASPRTATSPPWPSWQSASSTTPARDQGHEHPRPHDHQ